MRGKLLFLIPLLFFGPLVGAQGPIEDGDYYIQEISTGYYLSGGLNWGTQASLLNEGDVVKITYSESKESYTLDYSSVLTTQDKCMGIKAADDIYTDRKETEDFCIYWEIMPKDDGYIIKNKVFGYLSLTGGTGEQPVKATPNIEEAAVFKIFSIYDISDHLVLNYPINATCLIGDPNFSRCHSSAPWTATASNFNLCGGTDHNKCAESWHSTFHVRQVLENIPNGIYVLRAQAALRIDESEELDYPVVYANDSTSFFKDKTGSENNMNEMSNSFSNGLYRVDSILVIVENHRLEVGVKGTRTRSWACWDNFTLTYLGPVTIPDHTVSIGPSGYATFYSSVSAFSIQNTSDTEVYYVKSTSGEGAVMSMNLEYYHNNLVPKGKGVIIKGVPNTEYTLTAIDIPDSSPDSILEGCDGDTDQDGAYDYFTLDVKDGTLLFGKYDSSNTLKANKAYYKLLKTE